MQMYLKEEIKFLPKKAEELGSFGHVFLAVESRIEERHGGIPLWLRKAAEARPVSGVSLQGGPERPLCEAVKVKPVLL